MPIRPSERTRYPKGWRAISDRIRFERAEGRCECRGECGCDHIGPSGDQGRCDAPHGKYILRDDEMPHLWALHSPCGACVGGEPDHKPVLVVLTCAHLDHTPEHCDDDNLLAMCQRCHLRYDAPHHAATAHATRRAPKADRDLFDDSAVRR